MTNQQLIQSSAKGSILGIVRFLALMVAILVLSAIALEGFGYVCHFAWWLFMHGWNTFE